MAEHPPGHEINAATDEEMLSFVAGFYPATNPDKLSEEDYALSTEAPAHVSA
jgi:hypothetical protein